MMFDPNEPMFCVNLKTGEKMFFDAMTTPEHAAAYGHFTSNNMASFFFNLIRENPTWVETLEWDKGKYSMSVKGSDWISPIRTEAE